MNPRVLAPLLSVLLLPGTTFATGEGAVPLGTAFTYQGELRSGGTVATGLHDFEACLFDVAEPDPDPALACLTVEDQPLDAAGRFTLQLDFGDGFDGTTRHLELRVRPGASGAAYTALLPRQAIRRHPQRCTRSARRGVALRVRLRASPTASTTRVSRASPRGRDSRPCRVVPYRDRRSPAPACFRSASAASART